MNRNETFLLDFAPVYFQSNSVTSRKRRRRSSRKKPKKPRFSDGKEIIGFRLGFFRLCFFFYLIGGICFLAGVRLATFLIVAIW